MSELSDKFVAACRTAETCTTATGMALLIDGYVIEVGGPRWAGDNETLASLLARALRLAPVPPA
jgi:hypothetical protein